jgi:hypothetical protein
MVETRAPNGWCSAWCWNARGPGSSNNGGWLHDGQNDNEWLITTGSERGGGENGTKRRKQTQRLDDRWVSRRQRGRVLSV